MEEILASIRRIIADDQETLQIGQGAVPAGEASPLRNVLDLTEQHLTSETISILSEPQPAALPTFDEDEDEHEDLPIIDFPVPFKAEQPVPQAPAIPAREQVRFQPTAEPLLSRRTETSIGDAFTRLDSTVAQSSPKTLEDLAKEMLRPMLKSWLDDNLPSLVEGLVQAEIQRVTRTRR
jgi:cell pole-organizing protein PopZ